MILEKKSLCPILYLDHMKPDLFSTRIHQKNLFASTICHSADFEWMDWHAGLQLYSTKVQSNSQLQKKKINRPHQLDLEWAMLHSYLLVSPACRCLLVDYKVLTLAALVSNITRTMQMLYHNLTDISLVFRFQKCIWECTLNSKQGSYTQSGNCLASTVLSNGNTQCQTCKLTIAIFPPARTVFSGRLHAGVICKLPYTQCQYDHRKFWALSVRCRFVCL
jgi:hypothetical protein